MIRLASGVVLAVAAVAALLYLPPLLLRVALMALALVAAYEYLSLVPADGAPWLVVLAPIACWMVSADALVGLAWIPVILLLTTLVLVVFAGLTPAQAMAGGFCMIYVGAPLGLLAALHLRDGREATLLVVFTVVVSDSMQYYCGRAFGRRPLAPTISPGKTVEGALGGVAAGALFMAIAGPFVFTDARPIPLLITGISVVAFGILGDLFESRIKRQAGVKDSGTLIPGHGGVIDRIDALLFAVPAFYVLRAVL